MENIENKIKTTPKDFFCLYRVNDSSLCQRRESIELII